jgi:cephalosporin-C deacetylase-like acetyl esterase
MLLGRTNKAATDYSQGEPMIFEITLEKDGQPVEGKRLKWRRTGDDGQNEHGHAQSTTEPLIIHTSLDQPGFIRIQVDAIDTDGNPLLNEKEKPVIFDGGAGVQPEKLLSTPEPVDFDAWWTAQKVKAAKVPLHVLEMEAVPKQYPEVETYDVKVACAGGMPMSGYYSKTKNAAPHSAIARVSFKGYGVSGASRQDRWVKQHRKPVITLNINAHGIENGMPREFYKDLADSGLKSYGFDEAENATPENSYFYGMSLRVLKALEFIKSQPEWDGKTLIVEGGSQGGFQALLAAALDPEVTRCVAVKPWLSDLSGVKLGRMTGWRPKYTPALGYYDPVNHAKRLRCETKLIAGLGDYVCPPSGITVLYNNIPDTVTKRIEYQQGATHGTTPKNLIKHIIKNEL